MICYLRNHFCSCALAIYVLTFTFLHLFFTIYILTSIFCNTHLHSHLRANILQATLITIRCRPCRTNSAAMVNETVTKITSLFRRDNFPKCHLHLLWLFNTIHKSHSICEANAMGIGHDSRRAKHIAHNQIRTLSSHSWKCQQFIKCLRHLAIIFIPQNLHTGTDVSCFAPS